MGRGRGKGTKRPKKAKGVPTIPISQTHSLQQQQQQQVQQQQVQQQQVQQQQQQQLQNNPMHMQQINMQVLIAIYYFQNRISRNS